MFFQHIEAAQKSCRLLLVLKSGKRGFLTVLGAIWSRRKNIFQSWWHLPFSTRGTTTHARWISYIIKKWFPKGYVRELDIDIVSCQSERSHWFNKFCINYSSREDCDDAASRRFARRAGIVSDRWVVRSNVGKVRATETISCLSVRDKSPLMLGLIDVLLLCNVVVREWDCRWVNPVGTKSQRQEFVL